MNSFFEKNLHLLDLDQEYTLFRGIQRGFEKECLRVDEHGFLAMTPHPSALGSSLMHPRITTDYSESLLEFITPPTTLLNEPFKMLSELHQFTYPLLGNEFLWAGSMPCNLPEENQIPIAEYGSSNIGKLKNIYRRGLGHRYGRKMQTIAGIHYNFSLPEAFFQHHYQASSSKLSLKEFISEQYLGLIRNGLRWGWLLVLLFGASPAICRNFLNHSQTIFKFLTPWKDGFISPFGTSLRLSDLGYHNKKESEQMISYDSYPELLKTMYAAVHTPSQAFSNIGIMKEGEYLQLNDSILQIEDEHYAAIRPKRVPNREERKISALKRAGIEYIEIRSLDINPFLPMGVEPKTIRFIDAFLITCLFLESPPMSPDEQKRISYNHQLIVNQGRKPNLKILNLNHEEESVITLADQFFNLMEKIAYYLDRAYQIEEFEESLKAQRKALENTNLLPSALMLDDMAKNNTSYFEFIKAYSLQHKKAFLDLPLSLDMVQYYEKMAQASIVSQQELEQSETLSFSEFLKDYLTP